MCRESRLLLLTPFSPFAPVDEEDPSDEYCGSGSHGDDDASCGKEGPRMSLTNQVLQPDCRPVLEFGIVSGSPFCQFCNYVLS